MFKILQNILQKNLNKLFVNIANIFLLNILKRKIEGIFFYSTPILKKILKIADLLIFYNKNKYLDFRILSSLTDL